MQQLPGELWYSSPCWPLCQPAVSGPLIGQCSMAVAMAPQALSCPAGARRGAGSWGRAGARRGAGSWGRAGARRGGRQLGPGRCRAGGRQLGPSRAHLLLVWRSMLRPLRGCPPRCKARQAISRRRSTTAISSSSSSPTAQQGAWIGHMADQGTPTGAPSDVLQAGAGVPGKF